MNIPKGLQKEGIQSIQMKMNQHLEGFNDFFKISPPGYLHQNVEIRARKIMDHMDVTYELDYRIDNVLKVGDKNCDLDPSFDRDECVIEQLLNVRGNNVMLWPHLKKSIFSEFNQTLWVHTTCVR